MRYIFIFGGHPKLSLAELEAALERESLRFDFEGSGKNFVLVKIENEVPLGQTFLNSLGGTIKIGRLIRKLPNTETFRAEDLAEQLPKQGRVFFGVSAYEMRPQKLRGMHRLGLEIKKILKERGQSSRFVTGKEPALSSVIVKKNKLLTQGKEFLILDAGQNFLLGETVAVQAFESYGKRDFGRPERDTLSGMLPPKLAQMMLNLSRTPKNGVLLDPFCGSGTILAEAALLGYENVIGSDVSEKAIEDSKRNLEWLKAKFEIGNSKLEIFQHDAVKISQKLDKHSVDSVVTEPYLGPALRGGESKEEILRSAREIETLLENAFREFEKILKPEGKVVIILPVFETPNGKIELKLLPALQKQGWAVEFESLYGREGQKILRDIVVLKQA